MKNLPKIELHCHLDGSLRPVTVLELAKRYDLELPSEELKLLKEELIAPMDCTSLNIYLKRFDLPVSVMQTRDALIQTTYECMEDHALENVKYCELRFAPLLHTQKGLSLDEVLEAVIEGVKKAEAAFEIKGNLILSYQRHIDLETIYEVIDAGAKYLHQGVVAFDLCAGENNSFVERFIEPLAYARHLGYQVTIHAGETGFPKNVVDSINLLKATRIGHGVAIIKDEEAMALVKEQGVLLEVCPTSNIQTKAFASYEEHPVDYFYKHNIPITIGTDNRTVSDIDLTHEYRVLETTFGWGKNEFKEIFKNSVDACFADEETKTWLRGFVNKF